MKIPRAAYGALCLILLMSIGAPAFAAGVGAEHSDQVRQLLDRVDRDPVLRRSNVTVIVEGVPTGTDIHAPVARVGGTIPYSSGHRRQLRVPAAALRSLIKTLPTGSFVRMPYPHEPLTVTSQGVAIQGAGDFHALGVDGTGVKIGIIDLGFGGLATSQAAGELPANVVVTDYSGTGTGGTNHGTQVAEIVHDMAPGATLYLAKISTSLELQQAVNDMAAAGVRVVNHSVAWFGAAFYDGTGPLCDTANTAEQNGMEWVNAAGNSRNAHYLATFSDADGDLRHEFAPGQNYNTINLNANQSISLVLNWDAYPTTAIDYNLYLYDGNPDTGGTLVASSATRQRGTSSSAPYEAIDYTAPAAGTYYIVVTKRTGTTANVPLTLFSLGPSLGIHTQASSLPQPADCAAVLSVGAVNLSDAPEGYSSEGPTTDGRAKPDLSGVDRVATSFTTTFAGTSAASPHVAGAAGLLLEQNPSWSTATLRAALIGTAKDVATAGFDYRTGYGRLSLDADADGINHDTDNCPLIANPDQADLDGDGLGDVCDSDRDGDGLSNADEATYGTNPDLADTDGDGLSDGSEVLVYGTSPLSADTDGDGLSDSAEIQIYGTNPLQSNLGDIAPRGAADGTVNIADAVVLTRLSEGLDTPTPLEAILADMNHDGVIDARDVLALMHVLGY